MAKRLAVDIGGTFVDAIEMDFETGETRLEKAATTPADPASGVLNSVTKLGLDLSDVRSFIHGTTLALNALLEREGATTGIITTEGFRDVFELGRYDVPPEEMYNIRYRKPKSVVPRRRRIDVPGRVGADGSEIEPLAEDAVLDAAATLVEEHGVESIAATYLHSYANPEHEQRTAEILGAEYPDRSISISSDLVREHHEYERTSTTVLDAYIKPIFESYVDGLAGRLAEQQFDGSFFITRSGGGALPAQSAKDTPVHTILSGPAGGIIGASHVGQVTGNDDLIAVDMGGTSLDACVIREGEPSIEHEARLEHLPVMIPVYDIRTIGAGGGSVAWLDGDLLKVGPKSAGADPGPVCYGQGGTEPTVTDAALVLGYLDPDSFLGGDMSIDVDGAHDAMRTAIAAPLDMSAVQASKGIVDVTVANTVGAIREITVEKGLDPREFSMLAYGGAGPMIVPTVARELGVGEVLIPQAASVFSAWGMLMTDVVYDYSETVLAPLDEIGMADVEEAFRTLEERATDALAEDGYGSNDRNLERSMEMRYLGQEHTVDVSAEGADGTAELKRRFESRHEQRYGHRLEDPAEIVVQRVRGVGINEKPELQPQDAGDADPAIDTQEAYCFATDEVVEFSVYTRASLPNDHVVEGPAIVQEPTTTIVFHSDQRASLDEYGHVLITGGTDDE